MEAIKLNQLRIAAPCKADWKWMLGDDRVRFCGQCNLNVYNLTALTRDEAESLIRRTEGRLCVRFYRRKDGTILTRNCPIGLEALRKKFRGLTRAAVTLLLGFMANLGIVWAWWGLSAAAEPHVMGTIALPANGRIRSNPGIVATAPPGDFLMGEIAPQAQPEHQPRRSNR